MNKFFPVLKPSEVLVVWVLLPTILAEVSDLPALCARLLQGECHRARCDGEICLWLHRGDDDHFPGKLGLSWARGRSQEKDRFGLRDLLVFPSSGGSMTMFFFRISMRIGGRLDYPKSLSLDVRPQNCLTIETKAT